MSKQRQKLYLFSNQGHLKPVFALPCSTGKAKGDKKKRGDRKTPEGVYFFEKKISHGLDFALYGGIAFTLNYPNPVDKLFSKTGHGIWLHGRGNPIKPFNTKGCVAVNVSCLPLIQKYIVFHQTPILITQDFKKIKNKQDNFGQKIIKNIVQWKKNWQNKKEKFFSFYDHKLVIGKRYGYHSFVQNKKRLFRLYQWIDIFISRPKLVAGPGYVVSYFKQLFRSPGHTSLGIKRLYWLKRDQTWKIVGEEWYGLKDEQFQKQYLEKRTKQIKVWLKKWKQAWENTDLNSYANFYSSNSRQGKIKGLKNILAFKQKLWSKIKPKCITIHDIKVFLHPKGFKVSFIQQYEDNSGYSDLGQKTLLIEPNGDGFKILSEQWIAL
ncbi:MAG: L,D-transpeptidase family protein [Desulfonauticus sp.]|nr:L,D-transpeptidase family protein [Desulfonauticus sp.]